MSTTHLPWTRQERRSPAVAGSFYPLDPGRLRALVDGQLAEARARPLPPLEGRLVGLLVPHAGLVYSGLVAAAGWARLSDPPPSTIVLLGTNHSAPWLHGIGVWERGAWATPLGEQPIDDELAAAVLELGPPFRRDREAHLTEHSIEVQVPFVQTVVPQSRIVPLAVSTGTGAVARTAGGSLGRLVAERQAAGEGILIVASSDAAHYPGVLDAEAVNERLLAPLSAVHPEELAATEAAIVREGHPGLVCGMCGIEPSVVGLAAVAAAGARRGVALAAATSADAGGGEDRTVGYLAVAFTT